MLHPIGAPASSRNGRSGGRYAIPHCSTSLLLPGFLHGVQAFAFRYLTVANKDDRLAKHSMASTLFFTRHHSGTMAVHPQVGEVPRAGEGQEFALK